MARPGRAQEIPSLGPASEILMKRGRRSQEDEKCKVWDRAWYEHEEEGEEVMAGVSGLGERDSPG